MFDEVLQYAGASLDRVLSYYEGNGINSPRPKLVYFDEICQSRGPYSEDIAIAMIGEFKLEKNTLKLEKVS